MTSRWNLRSFSFTFRIFLVITLTRSFPSLWHKSMHLIGVLLPSFFTLFNFTSLTRSNHVVCKVDIRGLIVHLVGFRRSGVRERDVVTTEIMTAVDHSGVRVGLFSKSFRSVLRLPNFIAEVAIW